MAQFSEEVVHDYLFKTRLNALVDDTAAFDEESHRLQRHSEGIAEWRVPVMIAIGDATRETAVERVSCVWQAEGGGSQ